MLLAIAAALYFGLAVWQASQERHAFAAGPAPASFLLTAGHTYQLSVRGGRRALIVRGASADQPACTWSSDTATRQPLTMVPVAADARSVNVIATFAAPTGGRVRIECAGWGPVFVDDADDSAFDRSGLFRLLGIVTLTAAVALGLGVAYRVTASPPNRSPAP